MGIRRPSGPAGDNLRPAAVEPGRGRGAERGNTGVPCGASGLMAPGAASAPAGQLEAGRAALSGAGGAV